MAPSPTGSPAVPSALAAPGPYPASPSWVDFSTNSHFKFEVPRTNGHTIDKDFKAMRSGMVGSSRNFSDRMFALCCVVHLLMESKCLPLEDFLRRTAVVFAMMDSVIYDEWL